MQNSILTNMTSMAIRRNMYNSQNNISSSLERMASGLKLNRAKDGAADYVLSSQLEDKIRGMNIANQNVSHGAGLLEIANDTLNNMIQKATRIRNKSIESINGTVSYEERMAIQKEIDELAEEIIREKDNATYNKKIFLE